MTKTNAQMREIAEDNKATLKVGDRVRVGYPNSGWGEGTITEIDADAKWRNPDTGRMNRRKPIIIQRDDATIGYFKFDTVFEVAATQEP